MRTGVLALQGDWAAHGTMLDALGAVDGDDVELGFVEANSSCLIHAPGKASARYVVMPMRL